MSTINKPLVQTHMFKCDIVSAIRCIRYNHDGDYCMTGGSNKKVQLWNPKRELLLQSYEGHRADVLDVTSSHDNSQIVSGGSDKMIFIFDVSTGKSSRRLKGHDGPINTIKLSSTSEVIVSGSVDNSVKLWDNRSRTREPIQVLDEATDSVSSVSISGHQIVSGSLDGHVRKYDIRVGSMTSDHVHGSVTSVTFTQDGHCLLVSTLGGYIYLLDTDSGEVLQQFNGHLNNEYKIDGCLFKNDETVISGSEDSTVYTWSLTDGKITDKLRHLKHRVVHSLSSHPKENVLLTAAEGTIYLWEEVDQDEQDHHHTS